MIDLAYVMIGVDLMIIVIMILCYVFKDGVSDDEEDNWW